MMTGRDSTLRTSENVIPPTWSWSSFTPRVSAASSSCLTSSSELNPGWEPVSRRFLSLTRVPTEQSGMKMTRSVGAAPETVLLRERIISLMLLL